MKAPPRTLNTSTVRASVEARLTPLSSARTAMADGKMASKVTSCGDRLVFEVDEYSSIAGELRSASAGRCQQADNLHGDHFHDGHGRKDHGVADVGPLGRRHARGID